MTDVLYPGTVIKGVPVVAAPAEIDATTAHRLRAALLHAAADRHPVVVVDMTGTRFCDSAGLQTLLAAHRRAQGEGGELRLVVPAAGTVPRVLSLTGIDRFLPCFASLAEALPMMPGGTDPQLAPRGPEPGQSQS